MFDLIKDKLKTERIVPDVIIIYIIKFFYQNLFLSKPEKQAILFIVGCQRSGTSLMNRIFTKDLKTKVYRESSTLSSQDQGNYSHDDSAEQLRLNQFNILERSFQQDQANLIVLKPLVESQNILELLNYFPQSKALWMYRNYKDVVRSNLQRFSLQSGIRDLKYIVEKDKNNWRSEKVSNQVHSIVYQYYREDMNPYDAAALFWFARNSLFYELNLNQNSHIFLCQYEDLVTQPTKIMTRIYQFINLPQQFKPSFIKEITATSLGKGKVINLSEEIEQICDNLLQKLNRDYQKSLIE